MTTQTIRIDSHSREWAQKLTTRLAELGFDVSYHERWDNSHRVAVVEAKREVQSDA